jgi:PKD repeat protein
MKNNITHIKRLFLLAGLGFASLLNAQCVAGFTFSTSGATVTLTNTSTSSGFPLYTWDFGDSQTAWGSSSNPDATHNYNVAGTYTVSLTVTDSLNQTCTNTYSAPVTVTVGCNNLAASISSTAASACNACDGSLSGTVTGGNAPFTYQWSNAATTSSVSNACVGNYQLIVTDAVGCSVTTSGDVNCPDSCHADFGSSVAGNTVYFYNMSNDTGALINFQWDFGDATNYTGNNPGYHTYAASGTYNVMLIMNNSASPCTDTIWHSVTAGGPTSCSASFSMQQDSFNLNQWYIYGYATGQPPFTYLWDFGDTTTSTLAMPSHNYTYLCHHVICLSITDANGCTSTYCDSSMSHRTNVNAASMSGVTVLSMTETATGIVEQNQAKMKVWPNPTAGIVNISLSENTDAVLRITDLVGNVVMEQRISANELKVDVSNLPAGIYNLNISNTNMNENEKIVIVR